MGPISKALGQEQEILFDGKKYRLSGMTVEGLGLWEQYLLEQAELGLERRRHLMAPDAFLARCSQLDQDAAAGVYGFFSPVSSKAQAHLPGMKKLLWLRLKVNHPEVDDGFVQRLVEERFEELMGKARTQDAPDPNSPAPASAGAA